MRDKLIPEEKIMAIQEQLSGFIVERLWRFKNNCPDLLLSKSSIQKANSTMIDYLILTITAHIYVIKNEYTYVNIYVCVCIKFLFMSMYVLYI